MPAVVSSSDVSELRSALRNEISIRRDAQQELREQKARVARLWASLPTDLHAEFEGSATQNDLGLSNACTFIAATVSLQFVAHGIYPTAATWDLLLQLGGNAYQAGPTRATSLTESLPSVLSVLSLSPSSVHVYPDWRTFVYDVPGGYPQELLEVFVPSSSSSAAGGGLLDSKYDLRSVLVPDLNHLTPPLALILTGHNETYTVCIGPDAKVSFRDSHVTTQHDFGDIHTFFTWLESNSDVLDPGTVPPGMSLSADDEMALYLLEHNRLAIHLILPAPST